MKRFLFLFGALSEMSEEVLNAMSEIVRDPPSWFVAIMIALLAAHALDKLYGLIAKRRNQNGLIAILELFIVFVLSFLALHSYYEGILTAHGSSDWYDRPFALVVALIVFGIGSMVLYVVSRVKIK